MGLGVSLLLFIEWFWNMNMMRTSLLLMSFFVFLQLLAVIAHARTLSESSWNTFTQSTNLKMPASLQPPSPAEKKITGASTCAPESSSCSTFMSITQYQKPSASPPPAPKSPSGPVPSARPSSPAAECFCSWFTPITRCTSPCLAERPCIRFKRNYYGKRSSSSAPTSPASSSLARHVKRIDSYLRSAESLCNKLWNMKGNKRPSLSPPPPPPPIPHMPVASWSKSPPSLSLTSS